jgi:hypothetical protein
MTMQNPVGCSSFAEAYTLEQEQADRPSHPPGHSMWSIRTQVQIEGRTRDLALFDLAIDSKLRGCDVVAEGRGRHTCRIFGRPRCGASKETRPTRPVRID